MPVIPLPPRTKRRARISRSARYYQTLAGRLRLVAGTLPIKTVAELTGTHPENTRRYLANGRVPIQFIAAFCEAFEVNPRWLLFGTGRMGRR